MPYEYEGDPDEYVYEYLPADTWGMSKEELLHEIVTIARNNYFGMTDPLYALASTGTIVPGLLESCHKKIKRYPDNENLALKTLVYIVETYFGGDGTSEEEA